MRDLFDLPEGVQNVDSGDVLRKKKQKGKENQEDEGEDSSRESELEDANLHEGWGEPEESWMPGGPTIVLAQDSEEEPKALPEGKSQVAPEKDDEYVVVAPPKRSKFPKIVAVLLFAVFLGYVGFYLATMPEDPNAKNPDIALETAYTVQGFALTVTANADRTYTIEVTVSGGSKWPAVTGLNNKTDWPQATMNGESYTFVSRPRDIRKGEVQSITIPFSTVETWHANFVLRQYVSTLNREVQVN